MASTSISSFRLCTTHATELLPLLQRVELDVDVTTCMYCGITAESPEQHLLYWRHILMKNHMNAE